jgi:hypothetical protein
MFSLFFIKDSLDVSRIKYPHFDDKNFEEKFDYFVTHPK